ncbi:MAG: aldehyde dehydrogenase family protein [Gammaproteobacteria bacterium]|nr:aldehyde dehydrogenase family protein [Gammaproteobacteria bacterium]
MSSQIENNTERRIIRESIARARTAMQAISGYSQELIDELVTAVAWSLYKPENARRIAELAVQDTGIGNVEDKVIKNQRKTFGTLRDLMRVKTVGVIEDSPRRGLVKYAKPVGVVAAITPSTNPSATPVNKSMMALKGGNAIVLAPSPAGWKTTSETAGLMRSAVAKVGAPEDLVQVLPAPVSRNMTRLLLEAADLIVATGSQTNVQSAYASGTPAIGVGSGNVPVIIDETANLEEAVSKIKSSKTFDNATSCSSENSLIILEDIYDSAMDALVKIGAYRIPSDQQSEVQRKLWKDGKLSRDLIARDADVFARGLNLGGAAERSKFFLVEQESFNPDSPFADEKLSLLLTVYKASDFDHAVQLVKNILLVNGRGHSCGIHTSRHERSARLAEEVDVVRVLVNQAHAFGNGGSFDNAMPFTLSMGCGTWGGNSISENLNYRHFINTTHLVTTIDEDRPKEQELFGAYLEKYGEN